MFTQALSYVPRALQILYTTLSAVISLFLSWFVLKSWLYKRYYALNSAKHFAKHPDKEFSKKECEEAMHAATLTKQPSTELPTSAEMHSPSRRADQSAKTSGRFTLWSLPQLIVGWIKIGKPFEDFKNNIIQTLYSSKETVADGENPVFKEKPNHKVAGKYLVMTLEEEAQKASKTFSSGVCVASWLLTGYNLWCYRSMNSAPAFLSRTLPAMVAGGLMAGGAVHHFNKPKHKI